MSSIFPGHSASVASTVSVYASRYATGRDSWSNEQALRSIVPGALEQGLGIPESGTEMRALDLGAGRGHDARALLNRGWSVVGVDLVEVPEWEILTAAFPGRVRFLRAAEHEVPVEPGYDLIVDNGCFHHQPVPDQPGYLTRVAGRLAPGGLVLMSVFGAEEDTGEVVMSPDGRSARFFTPAELERSLAQAGLAAQRLWTVPRDHPGARYLAVLAGRGPGTQGDMA